MPATLEQYKQHVTRFGPDQVLESATELSDEDREALKKFIRADTKRRREERRAARNRY